MADSYLTVPQLAKLWKLHPLTIRRYIREGKLPAQKIGGRIRISEQAALRMSKTFRPKYQSKPSHLTSSSKKYFDRTSFFWQLKGTGSSNKF